MDKKELVEIRAKIEKILVRESVNEAQTKDWLIRPFFEKLGWDFTDPESVIPEETDSAGERPDYTFSINGQKKLLIEAKRIGFQISEKDLTKKLNYCISANVDFLVVTDGQLYKLYYSKIAGDANSKLLKEIDLLQDGDDDLDLLSFDSLKKNELVKYASNIFVFGNIKKALNKLFDNPPKDFVKMVNSTIKEQINHGFSEEEILSTLKALTVTFDYDPDEAIVPSSTTDPLELPEEGTKRIHPMDRIRSGEWLNTKYLYDTLFRRVLEKSNEITTKENNLFYGWQRNKKNICELIPQKGGLKVLIDVPFNQLSNEESLRFEDVSQKGRWGTGTSQCFLRNETDFDWFLPLVKKVYESCA